MLLEHLSIFFDVTWLLTGVIGLLTFIMVRHVLQVRSFPPGPFPLPIIGNLLMFRGEKISLPVVLNKLRQTYQEIYTLWLGPEPTVVVCSWDLCKEALITKKNDFSGRIIRRSIKLFFLNDQQDVIFSDFGPCWETLRKILVAAVRKYATSEKLAILASDVVDMAIVDMLKDNKPVDATTYTYLVMYNVLAQSAFGQRFEMDDPEFLELRDINDEMKETFGDGLPSDALPILSIFYKEKEKKILDLIEKFKGFIAIKYFQHKKTYQKGIVRDFTDAVLAARDEAEEEGKDSLEYLTDGNLIALLHDMFSAGTDTSRVALLWTILMVCDKPEVQKKMVAEIDENIGSRIPVQDDRHYCPYTYAVITETLRLRPVLDSSLEHKSICDSQIGNYKIPKGTGCLFHILGSHFDEALWPDPEQFKPERFLEPDGRFTNSRMIGYMPFGLGRRACPGEKLALADLFLIITRLLQKCTLELENGPGSVSLKPEIVAFANFPNPFKLIVKKRPVD